MAEDKGKQDEDDTGTEDEDDEEEPYEAPDAETWGKVTAALEKSNSESKKWRLRATGKDPKWKPRPPEKDDDTGGGSSSNSKDDAPKVDVAAERRKAEEETAAKFKAPLVRTASRSAFEEAGLLLPASKTNREAAFTRAMRLLDMSEIDVDDDGDISGLDDQVKAIKRDYPELFAKKGARTVDAGAGSGGNGTGGGEPTSASKLAAIIGGKG
jgi:hypothetical protein